MSNKRSTSIRCAFYYNKLLTYIVTQRKFVYNIIQIPNFITYYCIKYNDICFSINCTFVILE